MAPQYESTLDVLNRVLRACGIPAERFDLSERIEYRPVSSPDLPNVRIVGLDFGQRGQVTVRGYVEDDLNPGAQSAHAEYLSSPEEAESWARRTSAVSDAAGAQSAHADLVATLCDLAREGRREDFVDLARMNGVSEGELDTMWQGTLRRVGEC